MKYRFGDGKDDSSSFAAFAGSAALEYKLDVLPLLDAPPRTRRRGPRPRALRARRRAQGVRRAGGDRAGGLPAPAGRRLRPAPLGPRARGRLERNPQEGENVALLPAAETVEEL